MKHYKKVIRCSGVRTVDTSCVINEDTVSIGTRICQQINMDDLRTRPVSYDVSGETSIDSTSDFHRDGFDRFEDTREASMSDLSKSAEKKYYDAMFSASSSATPPTEPTK